MSPLTIARQALKLLRRMPDDPTNDPPPQDPPQNQPDPAAEIARIRAEAHAAVKAATETTRAALRQANPDLPDQAFAGDDLNSIQTSVNNARAIADHVRKQTAEDQPPPTKTPAGAGVTRPAATPAGLRGVSRIAHALSNPGPGNTE